MMYLLHLLNLHDQGIHQEGPRMEFGDIRSQRVVPFLDAIAHLLVQREQGQVVAVTLALGAKEVQMWVAENGAVPNSVLDHVRSILGALQKISAIKCAAEKRIGARHRMQEEPTPPKSKLNKVLSIAAGPPPHTRKSTAPG